MSRSQTGHSHARFEWQSSSIIINSQTGYEVGNAIGVDWADGWRHARNRWPENFRILKKLKIWGTSVEASSWIFFIWSDQISLCLDRQKWVEITDTARCTAHRMESAYMVSLSWFVSLSSCRQRLKTERNKPVRIRKVRVHLYHYYYYWCHHEYKAVLLAKNVKFIVFFSLFVFWTFLKW